MKQWSQGYFPSAFTFRPRAVADPELDFGGGGVDYLTTSFVVYNSLFDLNMVIVIQKILMQGDNNSSIANL